LSSAGIYPCRRPGVKGQGAVLRRVSWGLACLIPTPVPMNNFAYLCILSVRDYYRVFDNTSKSSISSIFENNFTIDICHFTVTFLIKRYFGHDFIVKVQFILNPSIATSFCLID